MGFSLGAVLPTRVGGVGPLPLVGHVLVHQVTVVLYHMLQWKKLVSVDKIEKTFQIYFDIVDTFFLV